MISTNNFFGDLPTSIPEELVETLISSKHMRLERIVSDGHSSPKEFWYEQEWHEWILVLQGSASLEFETTKENFDLQTGDYLLIKARQKHRVLSTSKTEKTIWLAIHFQGGNGLKNL